MREEERERESVCVFTGFVVGVGSGRKGFG